jgi:hypothetical protein
MLHLGRWEWCEREPVTRWGPGRGPFVFQEAGRAVNWDMANPSQHFPPFHLQPVFLSLTNGSGYQLFNYFQIVEPGSELNKSHGCQFPGKSFHIL